MTLNIQKMNLQKADISGSKWYEVNAQELEIDNVSLANAKATNVNMSCMSINDVNMEHVDISNANLARAKITHANFSHAVINHVHLFGTEFHDVVLPDEGDNNFKEDG